MLGHHAAQVLSDAVRHKIHTRTQEAASDKISLPLHPTGTFLANQLAMAIAIMVAILEVRLGGVTFVQVSPWN